MENLVKSLINKRHRCMCPGSNHAAVFFGASILGYGENKPNSLRHAPTIHAEVSAAENLPNRTNKRLKRVDLLVLRINPSGTVGSSKPCIECARFLSEVLPRRGYILDRIHYSTRCNEIVSTRFRDVTNFHLTKNKILRAFG